MTEFVSVTTLCGVTIAHGEWSGWLHGVTYPLTPCCKASAKGTEAVTSGAACRACGVEVPAAYGAAAPGTAVPVIILQEVGCPDPYGCASHTRWALEREVERIATRTLECH